MSAREARAGLGGGGGGGRSGGPVEQRSGDAATRRANTRRVIGLFSAYRSRLGLLLGLIAFSAVISLAPPLLLKELLDEIVRKGKDLDTGNLNLLVAGMVAVPLVNAIVGVAQTWQSNRIGQGVMHDLRSSVFDHLQRLSLAFFTRTRTGEVQSRIANDIGGVQGVVTNTATSIVSNFTTVVATAAAMAILDWRLALAAFVLLPVFVLLTRRVGKKRREITRIKQGTMADMSTLVTESLSPSGVLLAKTFGQSHVLASRFREESSRLADLELQQRMAGRWVQASISTSFQIMPALVYGAAGWAIATQMASVSVGTLVAFTTLQTRLFFPFGSLLNVQADVQSSLALFDRVFEYLDLPVEITERPDATTIPRSELRGEISFDDVSLRYDGADRDALHGIGFTAEPGAHIAIVGETGSGKTTLGYLVARLYDASSGAVRLDGRDLKDLSFATLHDAIGVVAQETYLFFGSVRENIRFARPDATDAEVEEAARSAQIHELISSLPDGYATTVGERGFRFSGGERQRIAVARAILRDPPVLVLDEATSALDVGTEQAVQEALRALSAGRTTITIAHRLSTVRDSDLILVLDRGEIVERGTHEQLVDAGGRYAAMVERDAASVTVPG